MTTDKLVYTYYVGEAFIQDGKKWFPIYERTFGGYSDTVRTIHNPALAIDYENTREDALRYVQKMNEVEND